MKKTTFHEDAHAEMIEAARFYEERSSGLGFSFLETVEKAILEISENPRACHKVGDEVRRKLVNRFPYGVMFTVEQDRIRVLAIAHLPPTSIQLAAR